MKVKKTTKKVVKKEPTEKIIKKKTTEKIVEETNGTDETINGTTPSPTHIHLTDAEKEKGKFEHFNISSKTIQKLKGKQHSLIIPTSTATFQIVTSTFSFLFNPTATHTFTIERIVSFKRSRARAKRSPSRFPSSSYCRMIRRLN